MPSQFEPAVAPGSAVGAAIGGIEEGQSMMQRASQLRQARQMEQIRQQQIEENQILLPVKMAAAKADIVQAGASVALATRMQQLRTQAGATANQANDEFLDATKLADWEAQSSELSRIQAKYAWMGNLPEYKPFLDAVDKARANAVTRATVDLTLDSHLEQARIMAEGRQNVAEIGAGARTDVAGINAGSRTGVAEINAGAKREVAADNRTAAMDRTEVHGFQKDAIEADREALKLAEAGNEDEAARARHRANAFRLAAKQKEGEGQQQPVQAQPATPAPAAAPSRAAEKKLYDTGQAREGELPSFTPAVKTPDDVLKATQQMLNDGVIDETQARELLQKLGFKKKGG